jgi:hypothetical protein
MELIELYKKVVAAMDFAGLEPSLHESYSGRGMYGKTTLGISGDDFSEDDLHEFFLYTIAEELDNENADNGPISYMGALDDLLSRVKEVFPTRKDSMGLGTIFYK